MFPRQWQGPTLLSLSEQVKNMNMYGPNKLAVFLCFVILLHIAAAQLTQDDHKDLSVESRFRRRCIRPGRRCNRHGRRCCKGISCRRVTVGKGGRRRRRRLCVRIQPSTTPSASPSASPSTSLSPSLSPSASASASATPSGTPSPSQLPSGPCLDVWFNPSIMPANFMEIAELTQDCPEGQANIDLGSFITVPAPLCISSCGTVVITRFLIETNIFGLQDCLASVIQIGFPYDSFDEIPSCGSLDSASSLVQPISQELLDAAADCSSPAGGVQDITFLQFILPPGETVQSLDANACMGPQISVPVMKRITLVQ